MDEWVEVKQPTKGTNLKPSSTTEITASFFEALAVGAFNRLRASTSPIFYVELGEEPIYTTFLSHLSPELRSENSCSTCRSFVNRYGSFALVRDDGTLEPVLWSTESLKRRDMQEAYGPSVKAIQRLFIGKKVRKDFNVAQRREITRLKILGTVTDDGFSHMYIHQPNSRIPKYHLPGFRAASVLEQAAILDQFLANYDVQTIRKANWILQNGKIPCAFDHKALCQWLLDIAEQGKLDRAQNMASRHNLLCRCSADSFIAPRKQVRSGALGLLLEHIKNNSPWSVLLSEWIWICGRPRYVRHDMAPSQETLKGANQFFDKRGSLLKGQEHRLCAQDDIPESVLMWASEKMRPQEDDNTEQSSEHPATTTKGCLGALKARFRRNGVAKPITVPLRYETAKTTMSDFIAKILPEAKQVALHFNPWDSIVTLINGMDDPKPVPQSNHDDERDSISAYVTLKSDCVGSRSFGVGEYNLRSFDWNQVRCLIPFPDLWDDMPSMARFPLPEPNCEESSRYLFVLEGIHEPDLSCMPHSEKGLSRDKDGERVGDFVGGIVVERASKDLSLRFKVETFAGDVVIYQITRFG